MALPKLSRLELRIMETLWSKGPSSIRECWKRFPKISGWHTHGQNRRQSPGSQEGDPRGCTKSTTRIFLKPAALWRSSAQRRMIDDLVALFGGQRLPIVTHLIESGRLTPEEVREAQKALRELSKRETSNKERPQ